MGVLLAVLYMLTVAVLGICLHRVIGLSIHARVRKWDDVSPAAEADLPLVTVQLPIYNEKAVVSRLIEAVCALDYPRERLQIQALDDSTDVTTALIVQQVEGWAQRGVVIEHV